MRWIFERPAVKQQEAESLKHAAVALYHARFERIHPFRDGNGRIGRIIMYVQLRQPTGQDFKFKEDQKPECIKSIRAADAGDLALLVNILRPGKSLVLSMIPSPFRIEPLSATDPFGDLPLTEQCRNSFRQ